MVIRSINNFFGKNSRWIFGIFTVVIIVSFMGFLTPGTFGGCGMGQGNEVGSAFGKKVTYADLNEMMYAGASLVQIGAANLVDPLICKKIIEDLPKVMKEYNIENLQDIIGRAK